MQQKHLKMFDGWETYPTNLCLISLGTDVELYHRRLQEDSKRLFSHDDTNICLETVISHPMHQDSLRNTTPDILRDSLVDDGDIEDVLRRHLEIHGDHYVFIRQKHTWAPLQLSEFALRKILTALEVNPAFLDILHTFGNPKQGHQSRSLGGYGVDIKYPAAGVSRCKWISELFYKLHYMSKTGREGWPWSERVMGIYHQYNGKSKSSVWIIIQPTVAACKLPRTFIANAERSFLTAHRFLIRSTSHSWREYLEYLETEVETDNRRARLDASMEPFKEGPNFRLAFSNVQRLQHKCELIRNAISVFASNTEILNGLASLERKLISNNECLEQQDSSMDMMPEVCLSTVSMLQKWAQETLESARQTRDLITAYLNTSNSQALTSNTASLNLVAAASKEDAEVMLVLAKAARHDSRTVKLVTVLAFVYLPGTFVATIFSTGFVTTWLADREASATHQSVVQGCTYMAVTVALTAVTLLTSYTWNRRMELQDGVRMSGF
ncbi:hypothetical protein B5807_01849 [Epicoccum nigrum]|uniref:CorA-like transporter domain-containing protein n=1 Tax=Epicoccum nigrum TaxID=105696 RepID=A0A1Y2M8X8_EPING|nr:hypothetical protein B5807_01849 [Epicoccum nigrum]